MGVRNGTLCKGEVVGGSRVETVMLRRHEFQ